MGGVLTEPLKAPSFQVGSSASPAVVSAGSGAMTTTNKPDGSLHLRSDALPEVKNNGAAEQIGLGQHCVECRLDDLTANAATTYVTYAPRKGVLTGVSRRYETAPASASGTVVTGIAFNKATPRQVLASGSEDEESLSNDTLTAHNLSGTSSDLEFEKGEKITITVTSNNADMTGGDGGMYYLYYNDR